MSNLNEVIADMLKLDGALGAAVLEADSGLALATGGTGVLDMDVTAAGAFDVLRVWNKSAAQIDRQGGVETVIGLYPETISCIRVLDGQNQGLALLLILDRSRANQALANHQLGLISRRIEV